MSTVVFCCGMPRSGTSYVSQSLHAYFSVPPVSPEETRIYATKEIITSVKSLCKTIFQTCLVEGAVDNRYSAWGDEDTFTSEFAAILPHVVTALSHRDYIESATIDNSYLQLIEHTRLNLFDYAASPHVIMKQPSAEINFTEILDLFKGKDVFFVICLREPYKVFCSLQEWGWVDGLVGFFDMLEQSLSKSLEIIKMNKGMVQKVGYEADNFDEVCTTIETRCGLIRRPEPLCVHEHWKNATPKISEIISEGEFNYYLSENKCFSLYVELLNTLSICR